MKRILGLDLGTNSIGWAVVKAEQNESDDLQLVGIEAAGSRIIPMDAATLSDFDHNDSKPENNAMARNQEYQAPDANVLYATSIFPTNDEHLAI